MKKVLLIALAAVAACMVSCSKDPKEEPWKIIENGFAGYSIENPFYCVSYNGRYLKDNGNIDLYIDTKESIPFGLCVELPVEDLGKTIDLSKTCEHYTGRWGYYISLSTPNIESEYSIYWCEDGSNGTGKCKVEYIDGPVAISTTTEGTSVTPKEGTTSTDAKFNIDLSYSNSFIETKFSGTVSALDNKQDDYEAKDMSLKGSLKLQNMYFNNANYYPGDLEDGYLGIRLPNNKYCGIELWVDPTLIGKKIDLSEESEVYYYVGIYEESNYSYWLDLAYYGSYDETATGTMQLDYVDGPYELVNGQYTLKAGHTQDESATVRVSLDYKTSLGVFSINKEYTAEAIVYEEEAV